MYLHVPDSISPVPFHQLLQLKIKAHQKLSSQACKPIALDRSKGSKSNLCLASNKQKVTTKVKFSCFLFFTWLVPLKSWYPSLSRLSLPTSGSYGGLCTKVWFYMEPTVYYLLIYYIYMLWNGYKFDGMSSNALHTTYVHMFTILYNWYSISIKTKPLRVILYIESHWILYYNSIIILEANSLTPSTSVNVCPSLQERISLVLPLATCYQ